MSGSSAADAARSWLDTREPAPPDVLRARLVDALDRIADSPALETTIDEFASGKPGARTAQTWPVIVVLGEAALDRLRAALAIGDDRSAAHELLAADALLTYTFEAAAEAGPEAVAACARLYGPVRLATLLEPNEPAPPRRLRA